MGECNKFYIKSWFLANKLKKIEKKIEKNWKSELLGASDMTWTCPGHTQDMPRTCPGHGRTHEDSYGILKIQNRTKTHQDTDIFVLQIAEQTFQICSHFAAKAASKNWAVVFPWHDQDMTGHTWSNRGFWKVRIWPEFDRNSGVFALKPVTPQPMNLTVIQSIEKLSVQRKAQYSMCNSSLSSFGVTYTGNLMK